jgi:type I restriction enzyme, S subunit
MKLPRYPKYKESGVKWLGQVPEHWLVLPIKRDIQFITSGSRGWAGNYADEGDVFIRIGNLTRHGIDMDLTDVQRVVVPNGAEGVRTMVRPGDVLFSITAYLGSVAVVPSDFETAFVSQHIALVRLKRRRLLPKWIAYLTSSEVGKSYLDASGYGGTKVQLSLSDVAGLIATAPPLAEQAAAISFLDLEIGKIEALILEQRRMIELLKEKRQAIISHAVTKGLNPNVRMKPSAVDWLGNVPSHWELTRLKYLGNAVIGLTYSPGDVVREGEGVLVLRSSNIQDGHITYNDNVYVNTTIPEDLVCRAGDILICSRNGSRALIGKNATIDTRSEGTTFGAFTTILRSKLNSYLSWLLNSQLFEFQSGAFLTSTINQLTIGTLRSFQVPIPPEDERLMISEHLRKVTKEFDDLIAGVMNTINLLQERRSSLITATVTGQIDVRNYCPEEVAAVCR